MNYSVTKNGKPLDKSLYTWDEETKTFSSKEDGLVLDFSDCSGVTFETGSNCTFDTRSRCTFKAGFKSVVIRRDVFEVIKLKEGTIITLNGYMIKGFKVIEEPKEIEELTMEEVYKELGRVIKIKK